MWRLGTPDRIWLREGRDVVVIKRQCVFDVRLGMVLVKK